MTAKEIGDTFDRMQLLYRGTSEPRHTGNRIYRGYWMIPNEKYEFRIVAVQPRNTWAIEVKNGQDQKASLLEAKMGITFIQAIICDKFEFIGGVDNYSWFKHQEQKMAVIMKRIDFLMMFNLYTINGEKGSKI